MTELNDELIRAVLQIIRTAKTPDPAQPPVTQQPPTVYDKLEQGQQYQVTVLNPDIDGKALLRIMGEKILVDTSLPLKQGQHLTVEVVRKNNDVIQLEVKLAPTQAEIKAQYLKLSLPMQTPIANLLKSLNDYLLNVPAGKTVSISQSDIQTLTRQLLSQVPAATDLKDPATFQKVLSDSGVFLESKLARGQVPENDLKTALLRIADQIRPQITETLQKTVAMTAYNAAKSPQTVTKAEVTPQLPVAAGNTAGKVASTIPLPVSAPAGQPTANVATSGRPLTAEAAPVVQQPLAGQAQKPAANTPTSNPSHDISQIKSVTEKPALTATQAAQKAIMLGKSSPARLLQSITTNLLSHTAIQNALNLLPKTELQLLLKQLLFKNTARAEQGQLNAGTHRLTQLEQLLRSVESGLARIQTQQLASVPQDDSTRQAWQLEIPLREQKELQALLMRFEQDDSESDKDASGSTWTVSLNLNIGEMGHIHSKIRLTAEVISTHFWAEEEKTLQKISTHLPRLEKALEKLGLSVNQMTVALGKPADPVEITAIEARLLDETA